MDAKIIQDVALPLISVKGRCFISISTPNGDNPDNPLRQIMMGADPSKPSLYNVMEQTLHCPECHRLREQAIEQGEDPSLYPSPEVTGTLCPHLRATMPRWKDPTRLELVHNFYEASGKLESYQREMLGQDSIDRNAVFDPMDVDTFTNRGFGDTYRPPFVVMTADPNNGGPSEMSIVTGYFQPDTTRGFVICGIEAEAVEVHNATDRLKEHIRALRRVERFARSTIVFVPELNLAIGAMNLTKAAMEMGNVVTLYSRKSLLDPTSQSMFGVPTLAGTKELYTEAAHHVIQHPYSGVSEDLVCTTPWDSRDSTVQKRRTAVHKLNAQLKKWARIVDQRKGSRHKKLQPYLSGKGPMGRDNDDVAMAFIMCCYISQRVMMRKLAIPDDHYEYIFREK